MRAVVAPAVVVIGVGGCAASPSGGQALHRVSAGGGGSRRPVVVESPSVPTILIGPAKSLDWTGFVIDPAPTCRERTTADGRTQLVASGSATVPSVSARIVGQLEIWAESLSGVPLDHGTPWPFPQLSGSYPWTLRVSVPAGAAPTRCVVQAIDPSVGVAGPQPQA
ncbi:MAG TPA: hypothetical protein VMF60_07870 [Acidimicrobiales bacterium]|nr:hypothetical protein [Acidimicrobiales bacterium]